MSVDYATILESLEEKFHQGQAKSEAWNEERAELIDAMEAIRILIDRETRAAAAGAPAPPEEER